MKKYLIPDLLAFTCEFTKNNETTKQYIGVRDFLFDFGGKKYKGAFMRKDGDEFDNPEHPHSYIVVAYYGDRCIGGARLVVKEPFSEMRLPGLESDDFLLEEKLLELELKNKRYGELSRLAVLSEYTKFTPAICECMYVKAIELKLDYTMWMGSLTRTRAYAFMCGKYISNFNIRYDVPVGFQSDPDVKKYLGILDFAPEYELRQSGKQKVKDDVISYI